MKKSTFLAVCILLVVVLANACKKDHADDPGSGTVDCGTITTTFAANVKPLMETSCAKSSDCHGTGSLNGPGALTTYTQVFNARVKIRQVVGNGSMPRDATFSAAQKAIITCWIDGGAPNN